MNPKSRQTHRNGAGTTPDVQGAQRPCALRQKLLQVGKREIDAQPAFGGLEIGGVSRCAGLEAFVLGVAGHGVHVGLSRHNV